MFFLSYLAFPLILGLVIIIHEFGHFIMARFFGVPVSSFNIGLGPKLISKTWGATEYCFRALPIGGYVRLGPAGDDTFVHELRQRPAYVQALISVGGVLMNVMLAFVVLTASYAIGTVGNYGGTVIARVLPGSPAEQAGLQLPSVILSASAGSKTVSGTDPAQVVSLVRESNGAPITFALSSRHVKRTVVMVPKLTTRAGVQAYSIGVVMGYVSRQPPLPIVSAVSQAAQTLGRYTEVVAGVMPRALYNTLSLSKESEKFSGPVGIARETYDASQDGLTRLLELVVMISMGLAFLNVLPIPPLDGYHFLVRIPVEWVRGKPLTGAVTSAFQLVGLGIMLALIVTSTWSDITALF